MILFIVLFILVIFLTIKDKTIRTPERVAFNIVFVMAYIIYSMLVSASIGYTCIDNPIYLNRIQFVDPDPRRLFIEYNLSSDIKNETTTISDYRLTNNHSKVVIKLKNSQKWYFINVNPKYRLSFLINKEEFKTLIQ